MKNGIAIITAVFVLTISGFALAKMVGGHGCCSTHQTHNHN